MSALAPSQWRGEDVDVADVAESLHELAREHAQHAHGHAATRTLNLLVAPGADAPEDVVAADLDALGTRHPSRTLVVREHPHDRLDALARIDCCVGAVPGGAGSCHDTVVLYADRPRLHHADSLVHPLCVGDLPVVLWLPGAQTSPAETSLARTAATVVLDSDAAADTAAALVRAARIAATACVHDLAWMRLRRWRERIAARFDDPGARALLPRIERLDLRCSAPTAAAALLLTGWIAARAGWTLSPPTRGEAGWSGTATRADGAVVAIASARADAGLLRLDAADASIEVAEPLALPEAGRLLAAALRGHDEAVPGYAPALAALVPTTKR